MTRLPRRRRASRTLLAITALAAAACRTVAPAPRAAAVTDACFPVERLPPAQAALARSALLAAADGEGLYTLSGITAHGALKPVSSDFVQLRVRVAPTVDSAALDSIATWQAVLPALRCGDVGVVPSVFGATYPGRDTTTRWRAVSLVAYDRPALDAAIRRHRDFFGTLGIVAGADPALVVAAVEHAERAARWRGYGYLFGYPDDAVDFFVASGERADSVDRENARAGRAARPYVEPRDFRRIDTWRRFPECAGCPATAPSFVYAVPKGAAESDAERDLRTHAAPIYAEYARRRAALDPAAPHDGIVPLLRAWRQSGSGRARVGERRR